MTDWISVDERLPEVGQRCIFYRPLARKSSDEPVAVKRFTGGNRYCWDSTVPSGSEPYNPTDGSCHVTHWMPLPDPPEVKP